MKNYLALLFLSTSFALTSCAGRHEDTSSSELNQSKKAFDPYKDIHYPSTLDLNSLHDLPIEINLKANMTSVKDQNTRGTCSFFSAMALIESAIKVKMNVEVNLSEEYFNYSVKSSGLYSTEEGSQPGSNIYYLYKTNSGFALESDWPYQPMWFGNKAPCLSYLPTDKDAPKECFSHNSPSDFVKSRLISIENFDGDSFEPSTTNELIRDIATNKLPLTVSLPHNGKGWLENGSVSYTEGMRQECNQDANKCGRHSVVIVGYNLNKKVFYFKNSWGESWGNNGYGEVDFDVVDRFAPKSFLKMWLVNDVTIPDELNNKEPEVNTSNVVENFDLSGDLNINVSSQIKNVKARTLAISSTLVEKTDNSPMQTEDNMKAIILTDSEAAKLNNDVVTDFKFIFNTEEVDDLKNETNLTFKAEALQLNSIRSKIKTDASKLYIRTTFYVFTDSVGYKKLKRTFTPLF